MSQLRPRRRFLQVGDRRVHYFCAGEGPPAVLVHSSPANARLLMKEIERLSSAYTVFAFDTPGFGLSDPLPGDPLTVADLADAFAETLCAIGMPPCPVFGTHTGAAIALEFGVRHPDRVTGMVLDGVPAFTDAECEEYFPSYFQKMPPSPLGGHYAEAWTRFRDQSIWFPWTNRTPANINPYDLAPSHSTHLWVSMFFEAAEHYAPAYRAASYYGAGALRAIAKLEVPTVFCASETDMLYSHLERFPPLKDNQQVVPIGASFERKRELIAERFAVYGAAGPAPRDPQGFTPGNRIGRQFLDGQAGQLHFRYAGEHTAPPLLLLHDAPGSGEQAEPLIAELAERFFVLAPDMRGCGESDPFAGTATIDDYVAETIGFLDALDVRRFAVVGVGFGSSVAAALAAAGPERVAVLAVQGVLLPDAGERADLFARYAPTIPIEPDGAHWYRTWLMLRDSQVYWPWYDSRLAAARRVEAEFSARPLHRWTMDVMRARASYGDLIVAALGHDAAAALRGSSVPLIQIRDPRTPLSAHDARLAAVREPDDVVDASGDIAGAISTAYTSPS